MRLISSSRAYAIASQWGSFNDASDPGRCLYGFHYGDGRPVSDQHRSDCLLYLRGILNRGGHGAMSVRSERELRSLIRFLANCPIRPGERAPVMVPQQAQQQQACAAAPVPMPITRRSKFGRTLARIVRRMEVAPDHLAVRADQAARIVANAVAGRIVIEHGGTDCDGARSHGYSIIPATVTAYEAFRRGIFEDAEGPSYCYIVESPDAEAFESAYDSRRCPLRGDVFRYFAQDYAAARAEAGRA